MKITIVGHQYKRSEREKVAIADTRRQLELRDKGFTQRKSLTAGYLYMVKPATALVQFEKEDKSKFIVNLNYEVCMLYEKQHLSLETFNQFLVDVLTKKVICEADKNNKVICTRVT